MANIGYARVSSKEQNLEIQIEQLQAKGCEKIFAEKISTKKERPELQRALEYLREGDKLIVCKIDRLARSIFELNKIVRDLEARKIGVEFIHEQIDFTTPGGKLMFQMLGAIAEFERDLINQRTREGIERAKRQGKQLGRKGKPKKDIERALKLYEEREERGISVNDIAKMTGVPRSSIYAELKKINGVQTEE